MQNLINKKIIDLSVDLENNMMYYPGDPVPKFSPALILENDGCRVTKLDIGSHTGTHMDAPSHFIKDGKTIDEINLSKCMGKAAVIRLDNLPPRYKITPKDIEKYIPQLKEAQIALFCTCWTYKYGVDEFYKHPYLAKETAELLHSLNINVVGVDMLNLDPTCLEGEQYSQEFIQAHNVLLGNEILIVENLINIDKIDFENPYVVFAPLKIKGADGSPTRAMAINIAPLE